MGVTVRTMEAMAAAAIAGGAVVGVEKDQLLNLISVAKSGRAFVEAMLPYVDGMPLVDIPLDDTIHLYENAKAFLEETA